MAENLPFISTIYWFLLYSLFDCFHFSAEILELAGNAARDNKKARVTPRHILLAIANDEELNRVKIVPYVGGGGISVKNCEMIVPKKGIDFI